MKFVDEDDDDDDDEVIDFGEISATLNLCILSVQFVCISQTYIYSIQMPYLLFTVNHIM